MAQNLSPVVYVPGLPASTLYDRWADRRIFFRPTDAAKRAWKRAYLERLCGPDDPDLDDGVVAGPPIGAVFKAEAPLLDVTVGKQAASLYAILRELGYEPFSDDLRPVGWDWRRPVDHRRAQDHLEAAIVDLSGRHGGPVTLIAHATGGLVVRSLLENRPEVADHLSDLVFFGVPWAGALQPLVFLDRRRDYPPFGKKELRRIVCNSWAVYDTLPPDPETTDLTDDEGSLEFFTIDGEATTPLLHLGWVDDEDREAARHRAARSHERFGSRKRRLDLGDRAVRIWNIVGWGYSTPVTCTVDDEGELLFGDPSRDGDGSVPRRSAAWLEGDDVRLLYLPIGDFAAEKHSTLWKNKAGRRLLTQILEDPDGRVTNVHAAVDHEEAMGDPATIHVRFVAQNERGEPLDDAHAQILDRDDRHPFDDGGKLTLAVHRQRWLQVRSDIRQIRAALRWKEGSRQREKKLTLLAGGGNED